MQIRDLQGLGVLHLLVIGLENPLLSQVEEVRPAAWHRLLLPLRSAQERLTSAGPGFLCHT